MRDPAFHLQTLRDLRFALGVMEEQSHIGLDENRAVTIRAAIKRQIVAAERSLGAPPSSETATLNAEEYLIT
jgi:hypothetical protein